MDTFLIKEELKTAATAAALDALLTEDVNILNTLIDENIARAKSYLRRRYDVAAIFSATGAQRSSVVLKYLKDLVVYDIYARQGHGQVSTIVQTRYKEALHWLEQVARGYLSPGLPAQLDATAGARTSAHTSYDSQF